MTNKRSTKKLLGLLALVLAFGLVLTGCPDPNNETKTETVNVYHAVGLTPGSPGYAANGKIIGLTTGQKYVVKSSAGWQAVKEDGTLSTAETNPKAAYEDADLAVLLNTANGAITGLTNSATYTVYKVLAASSDNNVVFPTDNGGKNALIDVSGQTTAGKTITFNAGASDSEGGSVVLITAGQLNEAAGPITNWTRIKGAAGKTYQFSGVTAGSASLEAMPEAGADYVVISGITSDFVGVATASTVATAPVLGAGSQTGTPAAGVIDVTAAGSFVVLHRGNWYSLAAPATNKTTLVPATDVVAAVTATNATAAGDDIEGLTNDEVYSVFAYVAVSGGDVTAASGTKNTVYEFLTDHAVDFATAGHGNGSTFVFILDDVIDDQSTATSGVAIGTGETVTTASKAYTFDGAGGTFAAGGAIITFTEGEKYCTITGSSSTTLFGLTRG